MTDPIWWTNIVKVLGGF